MPRDLTAIPYRATHQQHDWADIVMSVSPAVMARARCGDTGAQNNICIAFRQQLESDTGRQLARVEWNELSFEPLRA